MIALSIRIFKLVVAIQNTFIKERDEYEKLLDEYDKEIELLENKAGKTDGENKYLQVLLLKERKLMQKREASQVIME